MFTRRGVAALAVIALMVGVRPAMAQIEESLAAYTEANAAGYLQPFQATLSSGLGSGLYNSADIPKERPYFQVGVYAMIVGFSDDDRTFDAVAEDYFPGTGGPYPAPTVIGDPEGLTVDGPGGTSFTFPGGLDLDRLPVAAPQLTVGGLVGSEITLRYFAAELGDTDVGDISLFGLQLRHSISQYLPSSPVALAASFAYQSFEIGDGLVDFSQTTLGVQASKRFPIVEPYAGLSMHFASMTSEYDFTAGGDPQRLQVEFDGETKAQLTVGANVRLLIARVTGEISLGDQTTYTLGLTLGL